MRRQVVKCDRSLCPLHGMTPKPKRSNDCNKSDGTLWLRSPFHHTAEQFYSPLCVLRMASLVPQQNPIIRRNWVRGASLVGQEVREKQQHLTSLPCSHVPGGSQAFCWNSAVVQALPKCQIWKHTVHWLNSLTSLLRTHFSTCFLSLCSVIYSVEPHSKTGPSTVMGWAFLFISNEICFLSAFWA